MMTSDLLKGAAGPAPRLVMLEWRVWRVCHWQCWPGPGPGPGARGGGSLRLRNWLSCLTMVSRECRRMAGCGFHHLNRQHKYCSESFLADRQWSQKIVSVNNG
eukprot:720237-Rhodomonas_salina.1